MRDSLPALCYAAKVTSLSRKNACIDYVLLTVKIAPAYLRGATPFVSYKTNRATKGGAP